MNVSLYLYNFLIHFVFLIALPLSWLLNKFYNENNFVVKQRLGIYPDSLLNKKPNHTTIWIHAASIGEVKIACQILNNLNHIFEGLSLILSTTTTSGNEFAKKTIRNDTKIIFAPLDLYFSVRSALLSFKPDILVYIETEIWPNWIDLAHKLGISILFLNGRISTRSFKNYKKLRFLIKPILTKVSVFSMASHDDKFRILNLGAPIKNVVVNGNTKFDLSQNDYSSDTFKKMCKLYQLYDHQPVFLAGSVRSLEEKFVVDAYIKIIREFPQTILIIAPRHLSQVKKIETLLNLKNLSYIRRTSLNKNILRKEPIIILDTMGELMASYSTATVVFCGGSLVNLGGQNILEAAIWGKPIIHGPFMDDFKNAAELLQNYGASFQVKSTKQLTNTILHLLNNTNRAKEAGILAKKLTLANQGATTKHTRIIGEFIEKNNKKFQNCS